MRSFKIWVLLVACCFFAISAFADNVTFSYQGHVKVNGTPYNGAGQFKFAILNTSATTTLWSNDGSLAGEPGTAVSLTVDNGVFSALVGDTTLGMQPINASLFASHTPLKLRIWFNSGLGSQQLNPDQTLVDLALNTVATGTSDYTIYVNGSTGNDANSGLTASTAKKTIQAAVDIVPTQLRCNVTIKIAAGIYYESVRVYGISSSGTIYLTGFDGNYLKLLGDESWTTASVTAPNVRILGSDTDSTVAPKTRLYGINAHNCSAVQFEGLSLENAGSIGAKTENGCYIFKNCKAANNVFAGLAAIQGSFTDMIGCEATGNANGLYSFEAIMNVYYCSAHHNSATGVCAQGPTYFHVYGRTIANDNTYSGYGGGSLCVMQFDPGPQSNNNHRYGIEVNTGGIAQSISNVTFSGNSLGTTYTIPGGTAY